jgi:hypothetical protein
MKEISNFKLALTHCGNVFVVYLVIKSFIGNVLKEIFGAETLLTTWKGIVIMFILSLVALLFGILFSRWQLKRNYIIKDRMVVIRLSVIIFPIVMLVWNSLMFLITSQVIRLEFNVARVVIDVVLITLIFYWLSRSFLRNTEIPTVSKD